MFGMFNGEHENKIDSKGRLSIPADYRRELEKGDPTWEAGKNASMALVYGGPERRHIEVLPIRYYMQILKQIRRMPPGSRRRRDLTLQYSHQSTVASVDETGRIVLTARLREKLDLDGRALVVGSIDTFEIWKPETYEQDKMLDLPADEGFVDGANPAIYLDSIAFDDDEDDEAEGAGEAGEDEGAS